MAQSTSQLIAFQRAIEGEAETYSRSVLLALLDAVSRSFNYKSQRAIVSNLEKLSKLNLLSVQSAYDTVMLDFSNEAAKMEFAAASKVTKKTLFAEASIGGTINHASKVVNTKTIDNMINEANRLMSTGVKASQVEQVVKDLVKSSDNANKTAARTAGKTAQQVGVEQARQEDPDVIGYQWDSVLDGRTSETCLGLNGRKYYYNRSGAKPKPPAHYNCRSTTLPLYKDPKQNKDIESVSDWAKNNPKDAEEAMGSTRYKLFTDGKLKIERFTDLNGRPYSLEELKKRNAKAFERIEE